MPAFSVITNANGWQEMSLGEFCEIYQPKTISRKQMIEDGEYPVFGANGVIGRFNEYNHENSELLITCRGATCGSVNISLPKSWITGNAMVVRPDETLVLRRYLEYAFQGPINLSSVITGSAQPQITRANLSPVRFAFPSLSEQQRIVNILDEAFEQIANIKAQTMMNLQGAYNIFISFLDTIINDTNNDWKDTVLGDEYDVRDGTHDSPKYHDEGHYLITSKNLKREGLTYSKAKFICPTDYHEINKRSKVDKGDVLFAMIGTIGNPVVIEEEPNFAIKNVALFKVGEKNGKYLKYLLQSKSNMKKMLRDASGTTQRFVSLRYLRGFPIRLPSDEEQYLIVKKLDELFDNTEQLAKKYNAESENLDELKQSILQEAFNGTL